MIRLSELPSLNQRVVVRVLLRAPKSKKKIRQLGEILDPRRNFVGKKKWAMLSSLRRRSSLLWR